MIIFLTDEINRNRSEITRKPSLGRYIDHFLKGQLTRLL